MSQLRQQLLRIARQNAIGLSNAGAALIGGSFVGGKVYKRTKTHKYHRTRIYKRRKVNPQVKYEKGTYEKLKKKLLPLLIEEAKYAGKNKPASYATTLLRNAYVHFGTRAKQEGYNDYAAEAANYIYKNYRQIFGVGN
jgi:hypothetical protein